MKKWLLTLLVIAGCAGSLTWVIRYRVIPRFLANANVELVADWHAGLTECHKETGVWPDPGDPVAFGEKVYVIIGADGRRIEGGYMHGRPSNYKNGAILDVYQHPMQVTREGDKLLIASAGANRTWGDADDVSSDWARERYQPSTLARARAEAQERAAKKKK